MMIVRIWLKYLPLLLVGLVDVVAPAKILFFIVYGSRSHRFAMEPIAVKLADLGHEVDFLAAVKPEKLDPRITEIDFKEPFVRITEDLVELGVKSVAERLKGRHCEYLMTGKTWWDVMLTAADAFLSNTDFVEFVSTTHYDLIVGDFSGKEIAAVMAHKMNAKVIYMNTAGVMSQIDAELMGFPIESHWLPLLDLGSPYWFLPDHVFITLRALSRYVSFYWNYVHKFDRLVHGSLGKDVPTVDRLLQNMDLILLNERFPFAYPQSLPPFAIPVGGMHVRYSDGVLPKVHLQI